MRRTDPEEARLDRMAEVVFVDGTWMGEPRIGDLLADPITQALMQADRVSAEDVDLLLATAVGRPVPMRCA